MRLKPDSQPSEAALPMLTEFQVVKFVLAYLQGQEQPWSYGSSCNEKQKGDDLRVESKCGRHASIEAKGETTSKDTSRKGKEFSASQVRCHVAVAVYKAMITDPFYLKAIAVPDNKLHRRYVGKILDQLELLKIEVFWVKRNGEVRVSDHWNWPVEDLFGNCKTISELNP